MDSTSAQSWIRFNIRAVPASRSNIVYRRFLEFLALQDATQANSLLLTSFTSGTTRTVGGSSQGGGYCFGLLLPVGAVERMAGIRRVGVKKSSDESERNRRGDGCTGGYMEYSSPKNFFGGEGNGGKCVMYKCPVSYPLNPPRR